MTVYLEPIEILEIHEDQIDRYGGEPGIRDPGLLEAALFRPQSGYYEDIVAMAAALWESLSQNHPFVDGNKRTAFASTYTFLFVNGLEINCDVEDAIEFIENLYEENHFSFSNLEEWLRLVVKEVK
jgi:death-on-curing protein|tara:strand:- start:87 stop:464 length:378 start_codon:yes stop_codon:yes gene_type:complete